MKDTKISALASEPDLCGEKGTTSWVRGRNCVYNDSAAAAYRVSIRASRGWISYGQFDDLETATYVANIAILVEGCEDRYELNTGIGEKNKEELARWRRNPKNLDLEKIASAKYKDIQDKLEFARKQELANSEIERQNRIIVEKMESEKSKRLQKIALESLRVYKEKVMMIMSLSDAGLEKFMRGKNTRDPLYQIARDEAVFRFKDGKKPRAT